MDRLKQTSESHSRWKNPKRLLVLGAVSALVACGGGKSETKTPTPTPATVPVQYNARRFETRLDMDADGKWDVTLLSPSIPQALRDPSNNTIILTTPRSECFPASNIACTNNSYATERLIPGIRRLTCTDTLPKLPKPPKTNSQIPC